MKRLPKWSWVVAVGLGVASIALLTTGDAEAQRGGRKPPPAPTATAPVDPPMVKNQGGIVIKPEGLRWGMTHEQVAEFYDRIIDRDYQPLYKRAQPGPQTTRLDAAVAEAKAAFRRSKVEFGNLPTGVDSTPLKGEYTYKNGESMMQLNRRGQGTRYFFFMKGQLWKIYDEVPLGEGRPLGATFVDAIGKFATEFGVVGRVTEPDYQKGPFFKEVDWRDDKTHLRVADRSGLNIVAVIYEDRNVLANLASYRTATVEDQNKLDPEIEALVRPPAPPPGPPEPPKDKDKNKNKKK